MKLCLFATTKIEKRILDFDNLILNALLALIIVFEKSMQKVCTLSHFVHWQDADVIQNNGL